MGNDNKSIARRIREEIWNNKMDRSRHTHRPIASRRANW
jgi:hypothetical protein